MQNLDSYEGSVAKGSVMDKSKELGITLEEAIMSAEAVIIVDVSGSMGAYVDENAIVKHNNTNSISQTRYDLAVKALEHYQLQMDGKILVVAFSSFTIFCPNGYPKYIGGDTNMSGALEFCHVADKIPDMNFILISDGKPNNEALTLAQAQRYQNKIHTVFIGDKSWGGEEFLKKLSDLTGGTSVADYKAVDLKLTLGNLLLLEG